MKTIFAVDTGGTKTLCSFFELDSSRVIREAVFPTPLTVTEYVGLLKSQAALNPDFAEAVIALPGVVDADGTVEKFAHLKWKNFNVRKKLKIDRPVRVLNDAAAATYAAAAEYPRSRVLYLSVGTGVGSGFGVDGRPVAELESKLEAGHIVFPDHDGDWDETVSAKAFIRRYGGRADDVSDPRVWRDYSEHFADGLAALVPILAPDVVVVGGAMGNFTSKFADEATEILNRKLPALLTLPKIVAARDPNREVILGILNYVRKNR
jgi:predicted NBD/HSP70 family sugar kinase